MWPMGNVRFRSQSGQNFFRNWRKGANATTQCKPYHMVIYLKQKFSFISDAPVYLSYPHFLQADQSLLDAVEGMTPDVEKHGTYFKIQPVSSIYLLPTTKSTCQQTLLKIFSFITETGSPTRRISQSSNEP